MKKFYKIILLFFICAIYSNVNAQINPEFYVNDSCYISQSYFQFSPFVSGYDEYIYDFGDGVIDSITSFYGQTSHTYATPGTYNVTLTVISNSSDSSSMQSIQVLPENQVSFTYTISNTCNLPQVVDFYGAESNPNNPILSWNWSINGQMVGTTQNFNYTFNTVGEKVVTLVGYTMNGCYTEWIDTVDIVNQNSITANTVSGPSSSCGQVCDGFIEAFATGSNGPYTFILNPGNVTQTGNQAFFNNLCEGAYQIEVYDQNQCSTLVQEYVNQDSTSQYLALSLTTSDNYSPCNTNTCTGTSLIDAGNGVAPYQYSIDGGNTFHTSNIFDSLCGGTYQALVEDVNGCSATASFTIQNTNNISASSINTPTNGCGQTCDGSITASATGTNGPYTFILNPGNLSQTGNQVVFNNLCEGAYQIEVYDQNQCAQFLQDYVGQDTSNQITVDAILSGGIACDTFTCNGEAEIIVNGGIAPYQYSINGGNSFQNSNIFDSLCAGTYQVLVEDVNGCTSTYSFFFNNSSVGAQTDFYYANCDSSGQGQTSFINIYPFGGLAPYTYNWNNGETSSTIINLTHGETYTVVITDANGCTYAESFDVPENDCYTISGYVYVDVNENCIFDSTDYPFQSFVDLTDTAGGPWLWIYDYTNANGYYEIQVDSGTYYFDINGANVNNYTQNCPGLNHSETVDANNPNPTVNFFLSPPAPVQDLSISMYPIYTPTPGFAYKTSVNYCNDGTITMSGDVNVTYDNNLIWTPSGNATANGWSLYNHPLPSNHNASSNVLTYSFTNLQPGQCNSITITYETDPNAGLLPGHPIVMDAVVNPITGDVTPSNNVAYYQDYVTNSWDPNDKAVYPVGDITVEDKVHNYHVRFQNEGNANAYKVVIRDELDANLDLHTLRNVSASHDYILTIENDNELVFTFNNIQLPPKDVDEAASQGYVSFTLSQVDDLPVGTEIKNTADIYFDFNPAIVTNTVVNKIIEIETGISNSVVENAISIYPNPSSGVYNIKIDNNIEASSMKVYDILGNEVLSRSNLKSKQLQVNLQNSANGIYFLELTTNNGKAVQKLIKK